MGDYEFEAGQPVHVIHLEEYYISRYAETFGEYDEFRKRLGVQEDILEEDYGEKRPVIYVTWDEAIRYCREVRGEGYGLPTEAQWEKAARGCYGRKYPWGNGEPDKTLANCLEAGLGRTEDVDRYPPFVYGIHQMAGNVWEWTQSLWGKDFIEPEFKYPYDPKDGRENLSAGVDVSRVTRCGSWFLSQKLVRCAIRDWNRPDGWFDIIGFRVVLAPRIPSVL